MLQSSLEITLNTPFKGFGKREGGEKEVVRGRSIWFESPVRVNPGSAGAYNQIPEPDAGQCLSHRNVQFMENLSWKSMMP